MLRTIPCYSTEMMQVETDREAKIVTLMVDASTLMIAPGAVPYKRIYDDAIDIGCEVQSNRTGRKVLMLLDEGRSNSEVWVFSGREADTGFDVWLHVFNT